MKKIAVLTSGGDAPGMNAAVKGVVRTALNNGIEIFGVRDAYKGLVQGGDAIFPLDWDDVSLFFREGGTLLGSARYTEIKGGSNKALELKDKILMNLQDLGISGLIVIGGDGSLTGAYELYSHLSKKEILHPEFKDMDLSVVGVPGSIDNDIAFTDMSIGADTTLNTIIECIDKLRDTAASHKRVIIVEVMGRLRGYLATMSGLATGADRILIREEDINRDHLEEVLTLLQDSFAFGQKAGIIVRSEGAIFSTRYLKETIDVLLEPKREVRETVLGHLQRGGAPTSFERVLGLRMGSKAVEVLQKDISEPKMVSLNNNIIRIKPLKAVLDKIGSRFFQENLSVNTNHAFTLSQRLEHTPKKIKQGRKIAILSDGENISGMNMAIRAVGRLAINEGVDVIGIKGGYEGLAIGLPNVLKLDWSMLEMKGILLRTGTLLGVSSTWDFEKYLSEIKKNVAVLNLDGMIVVGNSETFQITHKISQMIGLPIVGIPASLNCDIQGTDWAIGMDSASNDLLKTIDRLVDTAHVKKKIGIIQLIGDYCIHLVKTAALAGGVDQLIIRGEYREETDKDFEKVVKEKTAKIKGLLDMGKRSGTILFFDRSDEYSDEPVIMIRKILKKMGIDLEITVTPQETYHGGVTPTAFDRVLAKRLGEKAFNDLTEKIDNDDHTFRITGIIDKEVTGEQYSYMESYLAETCACPAALVSELQNCFDQISLPTDSCVGMGGVVKWGASHRTEKTEGLWTCKKCGNTQSFVFDPNQSLCVRCGDKECNNFGYISSSRRF